MVNDNEVKIGQTEVMWTDSPDSTITFSGVVVGKKREESGIEKYVVKMDDGNFALVEPEIIQLVAAKNDGLDKKADYAAVAPGTYVVNTGTIFTPEGDRHIVVKEGGMPFWEDTRQELWLAELAQLFPAGRINPQMGRAASDNSFNPAWPLMTLSEFISHEAAEIGSMVDITLDEQAAVDVLVEMGNVVKNFINDKKHDLDELKAHFEKNFSDGVLAKRVIAKIDELIANPGISDPRSDKGTPTVAPEIPRLPNLEHSLKSLVMRIAARKGFDPEPVIELELFTKADASRGVTIHKVSPDVGVLVSGLLGLETTLNILRANVSKEALQECQEEVKRVFIDPNGGWASVKEGGVKKYDVEVFNA